MSCILSLLFYILSQGENIHKHTRTKTSTIKYVVCHCQLVSDLQR